MTKNEDMVRNLTTNFQIKGLDIISAKCSGFAEPVDIQGVTLDVKDGILKKKYIL